MASSSETETRVRITAVNQSGAAFQSAARDAQRMAHDTERAIQGMSRTMEQFSGSALGMRRALGAASVAFVGGETLRSAAVDYAALDRKMRVLQDTADNDEKARARSALERIQGQKDALKRLLEISQKTGTPFVELLAGFDARVKSGANTMAESVEQMDDLAMAARAMNADVADVALLATSVQKNLGAKPERLLNWLSMVKSASQEGRFEAEQLAKVMPRLASEMSAAGMNTEKGFATGLAMLETIHDRTGDYEEAERALRDTLQKMNQPELQQRIFDTTGIDMEARLNAVRRVGGDLVAEYGNIVDEALAIRADDLGVPYEKRRELLSFYIREQDALKGTRTILEDRAKIGEMRDRILKAGADPALMLRRPYEEFSQDAQAALDRLGNSWTKLKMTMGLALEKSGVFVELENIVKFLDEQVSPKVVKLIDQFKAAPFRTAAGFIEDYAAQARVNLEKSHLEGYQDTLGEKRERLTELEKRPEGDRDKRWFREWQRTQQDVSTLEQRIANQQQVIRSWEKYAIDNERKRNENTQEDMEEIKRQREMHTPQEWKDPPPRPQSMLDVPGKPAWYDESRAAGFKGTQVASLDANFLPSTLASEIKPDTPNALGSATETTLARIHDELRQMRGMMRGGGGGAGGGGGWPGMGGTGGGAALPGGGEAPDADVSALGGPPGGGRAGGVTGRVPAGGGEAPTAPGGGGASGGTAGATSAERRGMAKNVYDAFRKAGYSDQGARAMVAEVNRENSLKSSLIYGSHRDPHNQALNMGLFSYQGSRGTALRKFLTDRGLMRDGKPIPGQATLDAMAQFTKQEMEQGGPGFGGAPEVSKYLQGANVDPNKAAELLGDKYIKWRRTDPRYSAGGYKAIREGRAIIDQELGGTGGGGGETAGGGGVTPTGRATPGATAGAAGAGAAPGGDAGHRATDRLSPEQIRSNKATLDAYRNVLNADDPNRVGRGGSGYRPGGGTSQHARARGLDLRAHTTAEADRVMAEQRQRLTAKGLVEGRDFSLLDEVRKPSGHATAPHVHLSFSQQGIERLGGKTPAGAAAPAAPAEGATAPAAQTSGPVSSTPVASPNPTATTAGLRNFNLGNLKFSGRSAELYPGVAGPSINKDQGDRQIVFRSMDEGIRAAGLLAQRKNATRKTVNEMVAAQGGHTPGNVQAATNIARSMGVGLNDPIDLSQPGMTSKYLRAIAIQEHGKAGGTFSEARIQRALTPGQVARNVPSPSPPLPPRRAVEAAEQEGPPAPPGPEPIVRPGEYGYRGPRAAAEPAQLDLPDEHTVKIKYDMPDFPRIRERGEGQSRLEMARDMGEARRFAVSDVGVG